MKTLRLLLAILALWQVQVLYSGEWAPVQQPLERYEQIWKSSPFIAASEVTPQGEPLAQRFAVTGFVRIGNADVVFLFDRKSLHRFSVGMETPSEGVELLGVTKSDVMSLLRAKIKVEGQIAEIGYDPSLTANEASKQPAGASQPGATPRAPVEPPPPQQSASSAQTNSAKGASKPAKVIRRKPIDAP